MCDIYAQFSSFVHGTELFAFLPTFLGFTLVRIDNSNPELVHIL